MGTIPGCRTDEHGRTQTNTDIGRAAGQRTCLPQLTCLAFLFSLFSLKKRPGFIPAVDYNLLFRCDQIS